MENQEREKYLKAYYENEADANKQMAFALLFTAVLLSIIWIGYFVGIFNVTKTTLIITHIVIALSLGILISPAFYLKTSRIKKPGFKYFVLFAFMLVIGILNVVIPKHIVIGWAICIVLTNHYYNPKVGKIVFIFTAVAMLFCLYAGMFLGEYDANLLNGQLDAKQGIIYNYTLENTYPDTPTGRFEYLRDLLPTGDNRYLKVFLYYYVPRIALITIIFFVSNALNKRTYNLLVKELQVSSEQQKTKTELEVAKEIQLATLPVGFVTSKDIEIQAELKAAKEVGGDFYDYYALDDDHVAILIADVSGKGIPAAMFMMKTITCFKNYMSLNKTPAEIMKEVNRTIFEGNDSNMFVTCFLAMINTKTGEVKYANAGHNPPIIGQKKKYVFLKCNAGFVLGGLPEAFVKDEEVVLKKGDSLTLYTDGITEAMNNERELYGEERLLKLFNKKEYSCLVELHRDLKDDVEKFVNGADQSDDMTYITIQYRGDRCFYEEKIFPGKMEELPAMLDFLSSFANKYGFPATSISKAMVVADELLSNVVKYGYKDYDGDIFLRVLLNLDKKEAVLTIIDYGIEFNPFEVDNKPVEGDVSKIAVGGLGILIVKNLATEYAYDRINNKNITIIKKTFDIPDDAIPGEND